MASNDHPSNGGCPFGHGTNVPAEPASPQSAACPVSGHGASGLDRRTAVKRGTMGMGAVMGFSLFAQACKMVADGGATLKDAGGAAATFTPNLAAPFFAQYDGLAAAITDPNTLGGARLLLLGAFLKAAPMNLFQQMRDANRTVLVTPGFAGPAGPTFIKKPYPAGAPVPSPLPANMISTGGQVFILIPIPVVVANRADVEKVLGDPDTFAVNNSEMDLFVEKDAATISWSKSDHFILGDPNPPRHNLVKKVLQTNAVKTDANEETMLVGLVRGIVDDCMKAAINGQAKGTFDVLTSVIRPLAVRMISRYFGVPSGEDVPNDPASQGVLKIHGSAALGAGLVAGAPAQTEQVLTGFADGTSFVPGSGTPDSEATEANMYNWVLAAFRTLFLNLGGADQQAQAQGRLLGFRLLAYVQRVVDLRMASFAANPSTPEWTQPADMVRRLVASNSFPGPDQSAEIARNVFGTITGGIANMEMQSAFVMATWLNPKYAAAMAEFQTKVLPLATGPAGSWLDAAKPYFWEAARLMPQAPSAPPRLVLTPAENPSAQAAPALSGVAIPPHSIVLAAIGSAMWDCPDGDAFRTDRGEDFRLNLGFGIYRCLGYYAAPIEMMEVMRAVMSLPNVAQAGPMTFWDDPAHPGTKDPATGAQMKSPYPQTLMVSFG